MAQTEVDRLMRPFPPEADLTIVFGASPKSRKVAEIRAEARATLAFEHEAEEACVTLQRYARPENDPQLKWKLLHD